MFIIRGNEMALTRGDDAEIVVRVTVDGEAYTPASGDVFTLTVRREPRSESAVVLTASSAGGSNVISIGHAQTSALEVGRYSADIQLMRADGTITTVWPALQGARRYQDANMLNFIVMPEVTM